MKNFAKMFIVLSVAATGLMSTKPTPVRTLKTVAGAADSTFIYVYRTGQFNGATANWSVFLDGEKKCKLSNNRFMKLAVAPGKHSITAKIGGVQLFKKETEVEIEAEAGGSYYIACNIKQSITRARLEMLEVTKGTANKQMEGMVLDNCQEKLDKD
ncbi:DUF2846 domain-containing protein [Terrimonas sp. NA20]|uniref:DUF2846 domain-containing protein n=1 Tax=Terrimonas ginsenosidimutans TaxID=2908004 RepID=A0ABS9KZT4_9BACT|nr:DUF2846 domain-containing protein [Terrimonas ginsenosidimutans]MCG2617840.1 DUF2846 domain-containing protein [Terrimonas ginsenosidimutans]